MIALGNDWDTVIGDEFEKPYYKKLRAFLKEEYSHHTVYPSMYDIFNALKTTAYGDVKVVLLGQDPYHGPGQAHGMCFSVREGVQPPPSLVNIYKELHDDLGLPIPQTGYLMPWAKSGVLLLNTVLTVRESQPNSHKDKGWEIFTDRVIQSLNDSEKPIVFLLWGANAKAKKEMITNKKHLVLTAAHPSPLSAYNGFFGCRHFSKANDFLVQNGREPVDWNL